MDEISRLEKILGGDPVEPITRLEKFAAMAAGTYTGDPLTPVSRLEYFLSQISGGGGGGGSETKSTLIVKPSAYNGELTYGVSSQQVEAPEGIVYDKVWMSDHYLSWITFANNLKTWYTGQTLNQYARFSHMTNVETIIYTGTAQIQSSSLASNSGLKNLVLSGSSVVALQNINAFGSTPFASNGSGGTLWVPAALIASYQAATNWGTILGYANNQIKQIEGSIYE